MDIKAIGLWLVRKALYTAVGTVLAVLTVYLQGHTNFDNATLAGAVGGLSAAIIGDLRRKLTPDFLQIAMGEDPRSDG